MSGFLKQFKFFYMLPYWISTAKYCHKQIENILLFWMVYKSYSVTGPELCQDLDQNVLCT